MQEPNENRNDGRNPESNQAQSFVPTTLPKGYIRTFLSRVSDPANAPPLGQTGTAQDCVACRVSGTVAMSGIAGYLLWHSTKVPKSAFAHRVALTTMASGFGVLAYMRATTSDT